MAVPVRTKDIVAGLLLVALCAFSASPVAEGKTQTANVSSVKSEIGSKNILVLLPISHPSHHNVFSALMNALLERGHSITIVSSRPQRKKYLRLREILITDPFGEFFKTLNVGWFQKPMNSFQRVWMMYGIADLLSKGVIEDTKAMALKNENFDLVITETFFFQEPLLGFAHHFGCPSLTLNPFGYSLQLNELTGGSINPAYVPNVYVGGTRPETFVDRLFNTILGAFSSLSYHWYYYPKANAMLHQAFPNAPPLYDLINNISLTLINNHVALMHAVPLAPSVIEVGGMHIQPGKALDADLEKWIEDSEHGIVYFSLGSNMKIEQMPEERRNTLFASFAKLRQRVLVKWDGKVPANAPANCRFEGWVPQLEVLVHPKLKVFISHGGLLSTQESVFFGVPILGMPVFGDQAMNIQMAVQKGFAQAVSFYDFTTEDLDAALNELIYNPKYREQSQKLSVRFRSNPMTSVEKAVFYTELLMKLGDLKHLQPVSLHLHWYQYLLLDVLAVMAVALYVAWRIIRNVCSYSSRWCESPKAKTD